MRWIKSSARASCVQAGPTAVPVVAGLTVAMWGVPLCGIASAVRIYVDATKSCFIRRPTLAARWMILADALLPQVMSLSGPAGSEYGSRSRVLAVCPVPYKAFTQGNQWRQVQDRGHLMSTRSVCRFAIRHRALACCSVISLVGGCSFFGLLRGDCFPQLTVSGRLVDADTLLPVANATMGALARANGETLASEPPLRGSGTTVFPPSNAQGEFAVRLTRGSLTACPAPPFPAPDQIDIVVVRNGCETTFTIDVNENTVVDLSFPNDTLELKDPIPVPPCEVGNDITP